MENPKVSIITTTYNDKENLKKIIAQVKNQDYENIEYVIVDGGSTDGTLEVIAEAAEYFGDRLKWISEKDKGIYDVISKMVAIMEKEGTDGVHGDLYYMEGDKVVRYWHQGQGNIRFGWMPGHPTLYLRKSVYDKYGLYKTDYRISADYEFMIRILKDDKVKLSYLPEVLIYMSHGGTSTNSLGAYLAGMKEGHRALRENGVRFAWFTDLCRTLRVLAQFAQKG